MNLLREYIRELLIESIDPKIMSMIDQAEAAGYRALVYDGSASIYDPNIDTSDYPTKINAKNSRASVKWYSPGNDMFGPCLQAATVNSSRSKEPLGPLAYDLAIEFSGGLISDRMEVSSDANAVWDYYMNNRSDVQIDQLDIDHRHGKPQLTPDDPQDDCSHAQAVELYANDWHKSSLSKKISKKGTPVMDELRKRGMLDE